MRNLRIGIPSDCVLTSNEAHNCCFCCHKMPSKDIRDQVLLYYCIVQSKSIKFFKFCDGAIDVKTKKLFFGAKGSDERQEARERLAVVKKRLESGTIQLWEGFRISVSCSVVMLSQPHLLPNSYCHCVTGLHSNVIKQ